METKYTTIQGDTWDAIAYRLFGNEKYMKQLIESNWQFADILVFSSGTVLNVPEISKEIEAESPHWRTEGTDES